MLLEQTLVREWMTSPVISINQEDTLSHAHQLMKEKSIRRLPIMDKHDRLVGIITIGDVREASPSDATTLSIWELNYLWAQLTVKKVMTRDVETVHEDTSIVDVAELMLDKKISGLPVIDEDNRVIGMITESDIFRMIVKSREIDMMQVE
jgi:CBS domain-containing protein